VKASFQSRERWLLVLVCMALVAVSIGTTLLVAELVLGRRTPPLSAVTVAYISQYEAQLRCEAYAHKKLGRRIRLLEIDDHSSRFEASVGLYKIFFHGLLFAENRLGRVLTGEPAVGHYLNCYVDRGSAQVQLFEVLGDDDDKSSATRGSNTNAFGMPVPTQ